MEVARARARRRLRKASSRRRKTSWVSVFAGLAPRPMWRQRVPGGRIAADCTRAGLYLHGEPRRRPLPPAGSHSPALDRQAGAVHVGPMPHRRRAALVRRSRRRARMDARSLDSMRSTLSKRWSGTSTRHEEQRPERTPPRLEELGLGLIGLRQPGWHTYAIETVEQPADHAAAAGPERSHGMRGAPGRSGSAAGSRRSPGRNGARAPEKSATHEEAGIGLPLAADAGECRRRGDARRADQRGRGDGFSRDAAPMTPRRTRPRRARPRSTATDLLDDQIADSKLNSPRFPRAGRDKGCGAAAGDRGGCERSTSRRATRS